MNTFSLRPKPSGLSCDHRVSAVKSEALLAESRGGEAGCSACSSGTAKAQKVNNNRTEIEINSRVLVSFIMKGSKPNSGISYRGFPTGDFLPGISYRGVTGSRAYLSENKVTTRLTTSGLTNSVRLMPS
jgi:hypothetical protein